MHRARVDNKECFFDFGQLHIINAKHVEVFVLNGCREINTGDVIGGRRVTKIEIDGREVDALAVGMRAKITLNGVPLMKIGGPYSSEEYL